MNKQEQLKRKSEGGKRSALKRWGERVTLVMAIFPIQEKTRITAQYRGKEYSWAGKDRGKLLDEAFNFLREIK